MSVNLISARRLQRQPLRVPATAAEPGWVFALKSLLHPCVAVLSLLYCLAAWRQPLRGPYFLVAVLAFLASADFIDVARPANLALRLPSLASFVWLCGKWLLVVSFICTLLYFSGIGGLFHGPILVTWALVTPVCLWAADEFAHQFMASAGGKRLAVRKAVIVGLTDTGQRLEQVIDRDPSLRIRVSGFFEDRAPERLPPGASERILGKLSELPAFANLHGIRVAYITLPMSQEPRIVRLLDALRDSTVSVYFVPNLFAFDLMQARFDVLGGVPVMAVCETPIFGASGIAKRLFDIICAGLALLIGAPLLALIALGVRLSSPGPIFFRQRRYGLDGREIHVYKFRSMTVTEDGHSQYTQVTRNDVRVTPFGALIRRLSLDELPQLFNVLVGNLSMVGPRPHAIAVNEQYRKLIPGYMLRHKIKPGLTGWAQINGYRGGDDLESMQKRIDFDLDYLRNWSLLLDVSIVLRTASIVWKDKQAF